MELSRKISSGSLSSDFPFSSIAFIRVPLGFRNVRLRDKVHDIEGTRLTSSVEQEISNSLPDNGRCDEQVALRCTSRTSHTSCAVESL